MYLVSKIVLVLLIVCYIDLAIHNFGNELDKYLLDLTPYWTYEDAMKRMELAGADKRKLCEKSYIGLVFGGDLLLPVYYSILLCLLLWEYGSRYWFLPIFGALGDLLENFASLYILRLYPHVKPSDWMFIYGGLLGTPTKWTFLLISFALLINLKHNQHMFERPKSKSN